MNTPARRRPLALALLALAGATGQAGAFASVGRDPFAPPAAAPGTRPEAPAPAETPPVHHLVRVDGKAYVMQGLRRYGAGDRFGDARIECIVDAGVIVREQGALRLLPLFGGVYKRPSTAPRGLPPLQCPTTSGDPR
jgi:hypothetical protein